MGWDILGLLSVAIERSHVSDRLSRPHIIISEVGFT